MNRVNVKMDWHTYTIEVTGAKVALKPKQVYKLLSLLPPTFGVGGYALGTMVFDTRPFADDSESDSSDRMLGLVAIAESGGGWTPSQVREIMDKASLNLLRWQVRNSTELNVKVVNDDMGDYPLEMEDSLFPVVGKVVARSGYEWTV